MKKQWDDPLVMPDTGEEPAIVLAKAVDVDNPQAIEYLQRRRIPVDVARTSAVRFSPNFNGRPAILAAMCHYEGHLVAVTGRYLNVGNGRGLKKILTVGREGGVFTVRNGLQSDPLFLVEGVFDALSIAACGYPCVATIGRYVDWFPDYAVDRTVFLGFDGTKIGDRAARYYQSKMPQSKCYRMRPPWGSKDWNTSLKKHGLGALTEWISHSDSRKEKPFSPCTD